MTAIEFVSTYRKTRDSELLLAVKYVPIKDLDGYDTDSNIDLRTQVTEHLLGNFSLDDIELIRFLYDEELKYTNATINHYNLKQLAYYLYTLHQLDDVFRLYTGKFKVRCMDAGCTMDREMITVRNDIDVVITFVQSKFTEQPHLLEQHDTLIAQLVSLKEERAYSTEEDYFLSLHSYYNPQPSESIIANNTDTTKKPWWKFW